MKYTPKIPETNVNVSPDSQLLEFLTLLLGVLGIVVGTYLFLGLAVHMVVPRLPLTLEQKMASVFINSMGALDRHSEHARQVQQLLNTIHRKCVKLPYTFTVYLHENPQVNAVALPGGNIVVFTGLLEKVDSENELAFVLSHEIGHYANRDHLKGIGRGLVFMIIAAVLFGPDNNVANLLAQTLNLTELAFSRNQETRVDEFALEVINCTYGHVGGAAVFFNKLSQEEHIGRLGHYFSTHPQNQKRIAHLKDYSRSHGFSEKGLRELSLPVNPKDRHQ